MENTANNSKRPTLRLPADAGESPRVAVRKDFKLDPDILKAIENREEGNQFYYNEAARPDDMTYEWKRLTYGGMEDRQYQATLKRMGWIPVPFERHLEVGTESMDGSIVVGGLILMERHVEYTKRSRAMTEKTNAQQLTGQFERLKIGDNPDAYMPRKVTAFSRTYDTGQEVPE